MSKLDDMVLGTRKYAKDFQKFCEPLNRFYGINQLGYVEITNSHRLINIYSDPDWIDRCIDKQYYVDDPHMVSPTNIDSGFMLWSSYSSEYYKNGMLKDMVDNFNMCHGVSYIKKNHPWI